MRQSSTVPPQTFSCKSRSFVYSILIAKHTLAFVSNLKHSEKKTNSVLQQRSGPKLVVLDGRPCAWAPLCCCGAAAGLRGAAWRGNGVHEWILSVEAAAQWTNPINMMIPAVVIKSPVRWALVFHKPCFKISRFRNPQAVWIDSVDIADCLNIILFTLSLDIELLSAC